MQVEIRTPQQLIYRGQAQKINAQAENGALGVLPKHSDFVTALVPSVLVVSNKEGHELFFGIDQGLLVKRDNRVAITVQKAVQSDELEELYQLLETTFKQQDEDEKTARSTLAKLEVNMAKRFSELRKG